MLPLFAMDFLLHVACLRHVWEASWCSLASHFFFWVLNQTFFGCRYCWEIHWEFHFCCQADWRVRLSRFFVVYVVRARSSMCLCRLTLRYFLVVVFSRGLSFVWGTAWNPNAEKLIRILSTGEKHFQPWFRFQSVFEKIFLICWWVSYLNCEVNARRTFARKPLGLWHPLSHLEFSDSKLVCPKFLWPRCFAVMSLQANALGLYEFWSTNEDTNEDVCGTFRCVYVCSS